MFWYYFGIILLLLDRICDVLFLQLAVVISDLVSRVKDK